MKINKDNEYEILVKHKKEGFSGGMSKREESDFKEEEPFLRKAIIMAIRNNMRPIVDESLYGNDNEYYVKRIYFCPTHVVYLVSEDKKKIKW